MSMGRKFLTYCVYMTIRETRRSHIVTTTIVLSQYQIHFQNMTSFCLDIVTMLLTAHYSPSFTCAAQLHIVTTTIILSQYKIHCHNMISFSLDIVTKLTPHYSPIFTCAQLITNNVIEYCHKVINHCHNDMYHCHNDL